MQAYFPIRYFPGDVDNSTSTDPGIANVLEGVDYVIDGVVKEGTLKKYSVATDASDTKRQQIMDVLDTRLKTILTANGYKTDLGENVFAWKETPLEESSLPAIKYRDTDEEVSDITGQLHLHTLSVELEIIASGSTAQADLREMINDVVRCIGADLTFSGLAEDTKPISPNIFKAEHAENYFIAFKAVIEIEYTSERFA